MHGGETSVPQALMKRSGSHSFPVVLCRWWRLPAPCWNPLCLCCGRPSSSAFWNPIQLGAVYFSFCFVSCLTLSTFFMKWGRKLRLKTVGVTKLQAKELVFAGGLCFFFPLSPSYPPPLIGRCFSSYFLSWKALISSQPSSASRYHVLQTSCLPPGTQPHPPPKKKKNPQASFLQFTHVFLYTCPHT